MKEHRMTTELITAFPWGVLLVTDSESSEQIPSWTSSSEIVTAADSALVVRGRHADEGDVKVRVLPDLSSAHGQIVFDGTIRADSGRLDISDALGGAVVTHQLTAGNHRVRVLIDSPTEATKVDLIVGD